MTIRKIAYIWEGNVLRYVCSEKRTVSFKEQITHKKNNIFMSSEGNCVYCSRIFLQHVWVWKSGNITQTQPSFCWGIVSHMTCLEQSHANKLIWWVINRIVIHQTFSLKHNWSKYNSWLNIPQQNWGTPSDIPQFSKPHEKHLNNKHNSFHFSFKYAHMFILRHQICTSTLALFLKLHSGKTVRFSEQIIDKYPSMYFHTKWRLLFIYHI